MKVGRRDGPRLQPPRPTREVQALRRSKAFTLIELMAVMIILGGVTAGVGLVLGSMEGKARLVAAGEELAWLLETLSVNASITREPMTVSLTPGDGRIAVAPLAAGEEGGRWVHRLPGRVVVREVRLDQKVHDRGTVRLLIQPSGHIQDVVIFLGRERETIPVVWSGRTARCTVGAFGEHER